MEFITDNVGLAEATICDLYKARWDIELFLKQVKQALKLSGFLDYSENAVQWHMWTALLTQVILRFIAYITWNASCEPLFRAIRAVLWSRIEMYSLLEFFCGSAQKR